MSKDRNVFYVHTHDSGRYIRPYGYSVPGDSFMKLAEHSLMFRHCFSAAPTCSPSRTALLTGAYPHENEMLGLAHRGFSLEDPSRHLASFLSSNGWHSVLCGIQHEAGDPKSLGYDEICGSQDYSMGKVDQDMREFDLDNTRALCGFLRKNRDSRKMFISLGWFSTHRDFPDVAKEKGNYVCPPAPLYDCERNRRDFASYCVSMETADECLGLLLSTLEELDMFDDSIFIFTTDHGIAFPMMKCSLYDTGTGVGLFIHVPDGTSDGKVSDSLVSHIDIYPTLCNLLDLPVPSWCRGVSMCPILDDPDAGIRKEVFAEVNFHAAYEPMRSVRTDRYKLIKRLDDYEGIVPANIDDGLSKEVLFEDGGWRCQSYPREALYDLYWDPMERVNLIDEPRYQGIRKELEEKLKTWMEQTDDPFLHTKRLEKPAGAIVNRLECISPKVNDFE